jgi:hypothetical protein
VGYLGQHVDFQVWSEGVGQPHVPGKCRQDQVPHLRHNRNHKHHILHHTNMCSSGSGKMHVNVIHQLSELAQTTFLTVRSVRAVMNSLTHPVNYELLQGTKTQVTKLLGPSY